ncbi:MAG: glycosyltransferase [Bacteroidaceae bacterium]|nr:glycosyltransferase [Bacteroidaceae bacterium]
MSESVAKGLSVLVPVFNWDCSALLEGLHAQGRALTTDFELVVADDCSTDLTLRDKVAGTAESLDSCRYFGSDRNMGRAAIRNFLADRSRYDTLLFIDCDAMICSPTFLKDYMDAWTGTGVVCGGLKHPDIMPATGMELRYRYEKKADRRRAARYRRLAPYDRFTPFSFLIGRSLFMRIRFDESFAGYGYEDVKFGMDLSGMKADMLHIDNPLVHIGLEDNRTFLQKTESAILNLYSRRDSIGDGSHLLNTFRRLERLHLVPAVLLAGRLMSSSMTANLLGRRPSLRLFSFYKLYRLSLLFSMATEAV